MLRVQVYVDESVLPELADHLRGIPAKGRAEKIRVLAMIGLLTIKRGQPDGAVALPVSEVPQTGAPLPSSSDPQNFGVVKSSLKGLRKS